jgi:hypothetical protein
VYDLYKLCTNYDLKNTNSDCLPCNKAKVGLIAIIGQSLIMCINMALNKLSEKPMLRYPNNVHVVRTLSCCICSGLLLQASELAKNQGSKYFLPPPPKRRQKIPL